MSKNGPRKSQSDNVKDTFSSNVHSHERVLKQKPAKKQHGYHLRSRDKHINDQMRLSQEISYDYSGLH